MAIGEHPDLRIFKFSFMTTNVAPTALPSALLPLSLSYVIELALLFMASILVPSR